MSSAAHTVRDMRRQGRPFVFTLAETLVLVFVATALVASAALSAVINDPRRAQAKTVSASIGQARR